MLAVIVISSLVFMLPRWNFFSVTVIVLKKMVWNLDVSDYGDLCEYKSKSMIGTILVYCWVWFVSLEWD